MSKKFCSNPECSKAISKTEINDFGLCPNCYESEGFFLESMSFADLRGLIDPPPKRGRVNKVLREYFFNKNEKGHWSRKYDNNPYFSGVPSRPNWKVTVLPILINLLSAKYGGQYKPIKWVQPFIAANDA